jgi:hypothetical protein
MKRTGESEFFTFIISDVFSLKWFDWPKVSFEQVISIVSTFTADRIGSFFCLDRIGSNRFGSLRTGSVRFLLVVDIASNHLKMAFVSSRSFSLSC